MKGPYNRGREGKIMGRGISFAKTSFRSSKKKGIYWEGEDHTAGSGKNSGMALMIER